MSPVAAEPSPRRRAILTALGTVDDEAFAFIVAWLWQQSQTAGGFRDKAGWQRLSRAADDFMNWASPEDR